MIRVVVRRSSCFIAVFLSFLAAALLGIDRNALSKRNDVLLSKSIMLEQQTEVIQATLPALRSAAEEVQTLTGSSFGIGHESEDWRREHLQYAAPLGKFEMKLHFDGISNPLDRKKKPWALQREFEPVSLGLVPFRVTVDVVAELGQLEDFIASLERSNPGMIVRQLSLEKEEDLRRYTAFLDLAFPVLQHNEALERMVAFANQDSTE